MLYFREEVVEHDMLFKPRELCSDNIYWLFIAFLISLSTTWVGEGKTDNYKKEIKVIFLSIANKMKHTIELLLQKVTCVRRWFKHLKITL